MYLGMGGDLGGLHFQKAKLGKSTDTARRKGGFVKADMGGFYGRVRCAMGLISPIHCLVGALSMSNTILRSVVERTREIGSLRALGFTPFKISMLFSLEGAFLGLIGSLAGVVVRSFIMFAVNSSQFTYVPGLIAQPVPLRIAFTPMADLVLMSILITASACIAWIASRRAANGNIAASLTHS
jgi:putative ABC transport system permease protein